MSDNAEKSFETDIHTYIYMCIYIYIYIYISRFQNTFLRCPTPRLHCFLSSHWPSFRFLSFMVFLIPSIRFFFGLPRAFFCFGVHFNAILKSADVHSEYVILLFHDVNGYANVPQCYVVRTLRVLLALKMYGFTSHVYMCFAFAPIRKYGLSCPDCHKTD